MSRTLLSPVRLSRLHQSPLYPHNLLRPRCRPDLAANRPPSTRFTSTSPYPSPTPRKLPWQSTLLTLFAISATVYTLRPTNPEHNDAPPTSIPVPVPGAPSTTTDNEAHPIEQIPTGTPKVPFFPRKIYLPSTPSSPTSPSEPTTSAALLGPAASTEEYILLGHGIRAVSFLSIKVYVVGLYIARSDLSLLQARMIHSITNTSTASTLVASEKAELKSRLLSAEGSQEIWAQVLREGGIRSAIRITPVRDTNMGHMRDGFVRMVNAGAAREGCDERSDRGFGEAVQALKSVMGGASQVGTGRVLLLGRGGEGGLTVWAEKGGRVAVPAGNEKSGEGQGGQMLYLGGVRDERIARWVWMGYLAGAKVATEEARVSVVDGVLDLVERPIGTVETQVI